MIARVADIITVLESYAPLCLAESWDNPGLQVGRRDWPVKRIRVALDPGFDVVIQAVEQRVDMLVTHHPLIFKPLKTIDFSTPVGRVIDKAGQYKMAIYASHTNFDSAVGGMNDALANRLGVSDLRVLSPDEKDKKINCDADLHMLTGSGAGLGRIGRIQTPTVLEVLGRKIKKTLGGSTVRIAGNPQLMVETVAICTGSGSGLMDLFLNSGADAFISGDLRYHDAKNTLDAGKGLIDIGHFASEHIVVDDLTKRLQQDLINHDYDVIVDGCGLEKEPFLHI